MSNTEGYSDCSVDMQPATRTPNASISISEKFSNLPKEETKCYIYRVYDHLRNLNHTAYEPHILAIGPYHHGTPNTKLMEKHKLIYVKSLLRRKTQSVDTYVLAIKEIEQKARSCYADHVNFSSAEFTEMLLVDGCFIIELLQKVEDMNLRQAGDPIFETEWMMNSMQLDLMLFENQIPFFVLCKLFNLVADSEDSNYFESLVRLIRRFFTNTARGAEYSKFVNTEISNTEHDIKHLLHLIHIFWYPDSVDKSRQETGDENLWRFASSVTKLRDANVKFEKNDRGASLFDITFKHGTLKLPHFLVEDRTEALFRNLIAYEQYFSNRDRHAFATDFARFLDSLIDSPGDVEILCQHGILENCLGSDKVVSGIFNKLTDSVTMRCNFIYAGVYNDMNRYCKKRRNNWMAILRRNHLSSPWAILSVIAAVLLLLLTAVQTVCSVLQLSVFRTSCN